MEDIRGAIIGAVVFSYLVSFFIHAKNNVKAPVAGRSSWLTPSFLLRYRFCRNASSVIAQGYNQGKTSMFRLLCTDMDLLVVSPKYVNELRSLPESDLNMSHALYRSLLGKYSMLQLNLSSNIITRSVLTKLTPALPLFIPIMQEELKLATSVAIPECKDKWEEIDLRDVLTRIIARMSAHMIVGPDLCNNEAWLDASINYTETAIANGIILRLVPAFLRPIVYQLLPTAWKAKRCVRESKRLIVPLVEQRRKEQAENLQGYVKPNDFVQWMMDLANNDDERDSANIAHRALIMSQASIPSSTLGATQTLYDLCAHPEYIDPILEEVVAVIKEDGVLGQKALQRMRKLDSFMKESQRMNPPISLTFQRYACKSLTLSDGVKIPQGTQLCVASGAIAADPQLFHHPERFDGWRYYNKRLNPAEENRHQFTSVDRDSMHFGYGTHACPGRFFTSNEVKMIVIHFLLKYDLAFRPGEGRPKNMTHDEMIFPNLAARILIRERETQR
ncbi:putative cytochrome P450 [Clathrospora elynae]|uniref:Putative cytochrome P450 n=1 Tax=Clathrospora elynae TaxID=706981 RepID=A0A6A5SSK2_9PLEO|nr:putative cytochrome P450 [Clathrospora elynae]